MEAQSYCARVIAPLPTIAASTWFRRARALSGFPNGS